MESFDEMVNLLNSSPSKDELNDSLVKKLLLYFISKNDIIKKNNRIQ